MGYIYQKSGSDGVVQDENSYSYIGRHDVELFSGLLLYLFVMCHPRNEAFLKPPIYGIKH